MFQNFFNWYQNDPKAKSKIIFWIITVLILSLVFGGIWFINNRAISQNRNLATSSVSISNSSQDIVFNTENTTLLTKLSEDATIFSGRVYFSVGGDFLYFNSARKGFYNKKAINSNDNLIPDNVQFLNNNLLISSNFGNYLVNKNTLEALQVLTGFYYLNYLEKDKVYIGAKANGQNLEVRTFVDPGNANKSQLFDTINLFSPTTFGSWAIYNFDNKPYLFYYENFDKTGKLDIWLLEKNNSRKVQTINGIVSSKISNGALIYTTNSSAYYLDLKKSSIPLEMNFNEYRIRRGLVGNISALRCTLNFSLTESYCLVKKNTLDIYEVKAQDVILKLNLTTKEVSDLTENLVITASGLYADKDGKLNFISAQNGFIYKIN